MNVQEVIAASGVAVSLFGFAVYFRLLYLHSIKPHAFSWFIWGLLACIAFAAQYTQGGGVGSIISLVDILFCFVIFWIAVLRHEISYTRFDWTMLLLVFVSLLLWWLTDSPTWSVILITLIDLFGYLPTVRKSYHRPFEESITLFTCATLKYLAAFLAMNSYSIATALYPFSLVIMDGGFVLFLIVRRRMVSVSGGSK